MTEKSPKKYMYADQHEEVTRLEAQAKANEKVTENELSIMDLKTGMNVLDAGCGTGAASRMIARKVTPGKVHGIDMDPLFISEAMKLAKKEGITNIQFELGNVDELNLDDDTFDATYCRLVLMHVKDPVKTLIELKRVTRKNGIIAVSDNDDGGVITYPDIPKAMDAWSKYGKLAITEGSDRYIGRKLFSIFSQAGLKSINIFPFTVHVTQQTPDLLKMAISVPVQIIESSKNDLINQGYITIQEYEEGMNDIQQFLKHPGAFMMGTSFFAIGKVP